MKITHIAAIAAVQEVKAVPAVEAVEAKIVVELTAHEAARTAAALGRVAHSPDSELSLFSSLKRFGKTAGHDFTATEMYKGTYPTLVIG